MPLADPLPAASPQQAGRQKLRDSWTILLDRIQPDPEQPRKHFDAEELRQLANAITSRGLRMPIEVRWSDQHGSYIIIDGERRFRAAQLAKLDIVPCLIRDVPEREILIDQVMLNYQRADLLPYETADALVRLRDELDFLPTDISRQTGIPKGEVSKLLALVDKVESTVQDRVRNFPDVSLTKRHLYNLAQLPPAQQVRMARKIEREQLTATETERLIRQKKEDRKAIHSVAHYRYKTTNSTVIVSFERRHIDPNEVLHALREALRLAKEEFSE